MYFIEILTKLFKKKKIEEYDFEPKDEVEQAIEDSKNCKHTFVPIDQTGKVFACVNCGLVIKGKPKNLNFFEGDK